MATEFDPRVPGAGADLTTDSDFRSFIPADTGAGVLTVNPDGFTADGRVEAPDAGIGRDPAGSWRPIGDLGSREPLDIEPRQMDPIEVFTRLVWAGDARAEMLTRGAREASAPVAPADRVGEPSMIELAQGKDVVAELGTGLFKRAEEISKKG